MALEDIRGQLHLLEVGITSLKEGQRSQAQYAGLMMREIMEIRADVKAARTLAEYMSPKLAPLLHDPGLIVELEELKRINDQARTAMLESIPPMKRPAHPSFDDLSPTGKHAAITEAQLMLQSALDRVRDLEDKIAEREKTAAEKQAALQKQIDDNDSKRKFWSKTIIGSVVSVAVVVAAWQITTTLASHEKSTTVETKEKQR